ncbi:MAG TPA: LCP family protein [Chloroflexota bacterium]|nr:LCP family protein [Chloroflexota bacterium]
MQPPAPRRKASKLGLALLGIFGLVLVAAGVAAYKTLNFVSAVSTAGLGSNVRSVVGGALPLAASPTPAPAGPLNVLLLGYGGAGHDGPDLTDSIMVLRFDPRTKQAALISVPRDIWARIPYSASGGTFSKINTAYAIGLNDQGYPDKQAQFTGRQGGGNLAAYVVGSLLGLPIHNWVAVDFHAFKSVVDALGGVDVNVQTAFTDTRYPRNDDATIDPSWMTIHFNAGPQHMTGERALEFARSRHSLQDGTDFGRSRRQQLLMLAIKSRALSPAGMTKLFGLMDALSGDFTTNMTIGQITSLAQAARGLDPNAVDRVSIDDTNYLVDGVSADGQSILLPKGRSWAGVQAAMAGVFQAPAVKTEGARIQVWNATGETGLATTATSLLDGLGLQTLPPQNAPTTGLQASEIHDFSQGRDTATVQELASIFSARVVTEPPPAGDAVDIKVVLGSSYIPASANGVTRYDNTTWIPGQATANANSTAAKSSRGAVQAPAMPIPRAHGVQSVSAVAEPASSPRPAGLATTGHGTGAPARAHVATG